MKKIFLNKLLTLLVMMLMTLTSNAQRELLIPDNEFLGSVFILGGTTANVNDVLTYIIKPFGVTITNSDWSVTGGVIQTQSMTSVSIKWTNVGMGIIGYTALTNLGIREASKPILVVGAQTPMIPENPTIIFQDCTNATLHIDANLIPTGDQWFWQGTNSYGLDTTLPATIDDPDYLVTTSGTFYIRAFNATTGLWSALSGSVSVTLGTVGGTTWYSDEIDGDGLGDPNITLVQCDQPINYVANSNDLCPDEVGEAINNGCAFVSSLSNENYIYTIAPQIAVSDLNSLTENRQSLQNVTYFDGLGRPMQSIAIKQSKTEKDIITHIEYDALGRQEKNYLPYVPTVTGLEGSYRTNDQELATNDYYTTHFPTELGAIPNPYSQKLFEASPLNRVLKQAAPGEDWKLGGGHEIEFEYLTNTGTTEVRLCQVVLDVNYNPSLLENDLTYYEVGELYKTITKDEDHSGTTTNHTTEEFKDKQGRVVLKRTYADIDNISTSHDTYYIYDDYGNLTYVLPPNIDTSIAAITTISSQLDDLGYQYKYDKRNRLIEKKIPGKGKEYIVYDNLNRPVLTQDAIQKLNNQWLFTKYDVFGRVTYTGIYTHSSDISQDAMQVHFNTQNDVATKLYESKDEIGTGYDTSYYSNSNFPNTGIEILTVNYYDDYNFDLADTFDPNINNVLIYGIYPTLRTKGLVTGSKVKVLTTNNWITTVSYYDEKARPIHIYAYNDYLKTTDVVSNKLDFVGKVDQTITHHTNTNDNLPTITTIDDFDYDHVGRLVKQTQTLDGNQEVIAENSYDELGQLESKEVGGSTARLQKVDYTYNIRGWLKAINNETNTTDNDLFNFKIGYNEGASPLYNGNISLTEWSTASINDTTNPVSSLYNYTYDALNRITSGIDNTNNYNLTFVDYDKNGNIQHLKRSGHIDINATTFGTMDDLVYTYDGANKLINVLDNGNDLYGFIDNQNNKENDYIYDLNGNMTYDKNKEITITYNHLNLPKDIFKSEGSISYVYDATGVKMAKKVMYIMSSFTNIYYAGNYVYKESIPYVYGGLGDRTFTLQFFNHPEGYVEPTIINGTVDEWNYVYQYKDHLGNVRLSYSDADLNGSIDPATEIIEEKNYYPFGLIQKGYNNVVNGTAHPYGFNGKEENQELGLEWLDFSARNYDPAIGRWMNLDPLAEEMRRHSPYNYAFDNPIFFIDPDGMAPFTVIGADEKSRENIRNQLPAESQKYVKFDENGKLDATLIAQGAKENPDSGNLQRLSYLASSEDTYVYSSADHYHANDSDTGEIETVGFTDSTVNGGGGGLGITLYSDKTVTNTAETSIDENTNIVVSNLMSDEKQAKTTAHETVHAYLYDLKKNDGGTEEPNHTFISGGTDKETGGPILIYTSPKLIKPAEKEAVKNYKENQKKKQ